MNGISFFEFKMFGKFYDKYGFTIIFYISILSLIAILLYNIYWGQSGSYQDHTSLIWNLFGAPIGTKKDKFPESSGEMECRRAAEALTGKSFPKRRPDFLKNEITMSNLEIDCYCDELKIGIEYNGKQHYEYVPYFHKSKDAFYNTKYRDDMKKRLCKRHGITLITIPYTIPVDRIENELMSQFRGLGIL